MKTLLLALAAMPLMAAPAIAMPLMSTAIDRVELDIAAAGPFQSEIVQVSSKKKHALKAAVAQSDDPAGHDANDDHGVDPAGHDANDDNGADPADHDAGDDHDHGGSGGDNNGGNGGHGGGGND